MNISFYGSHNAAFTIADASIRAWLLPVTPPNVVPPKEEPS